MVVGIGLLIWSATAFIVGVVIGVIMGRCGDGDMVANEDIFVDTPHHD